MQTITTEINSLAEQSPMTSPLPETPYLAGKTPDNKEFIIPLKTHFQDHKIFTLGRSNENDFPINDPQKFISREHCRLTSRTEYIWIYDDDGGAAGEASQSGTFVSSVRNPNQEIDVRKEGNKGYRLRDGDTFYFVGKVDDENISFLWHSGQYFHLLYILYLSNSCTDPLLKIELHSPKIFWHQRADNLYPLSELQAIFPRKIQQGKKE